MEMLDCDGNCEWCYWWHGHCPLDSSAPEYELQEEVESNV